MQEKKNQGAQMVSYLNQPRSLKQRSLGCCVCVRGDGGEGYRGGGCAQPVSLCNHVVVSVFIGSSHR